MTVPPRQRASGDFFFVLCTAVRLVFSSEKVTHYIGHFLVIV